MSILYFATGNQGKLLSARRYFKDYNIQIEKIDLKLDEIQDLDVRNVARKKAQDAYRLSGKPCMVLDASFVIPELNNFPGTFVSHILASIGLDGLEKLVTVGTPCYFEEAIAFCDGQNTVVFSGQLHGKFVARR